MTKTCRRCGNDRPRADFYAAPRMRDGLQSWCKPCYKEYRAERYQLRRDAELASNRKWELENREARKAIARRSAAKHKEARSATARRWRENNLDRHRENYRRWARENPAAARRLSLERRGRKVSAPGYASAAQIAARWELFAGRCWMCGAAANSLDHVIALSRGGTNWPANLRPACIPCNSGKRDRKRDVVGPIFR